VILFWVWAILWFLPTHSPIIPLSLYSSPQRGSFPYPHLSNHFVMCVVVTFYHPKLKGGIDILLPGALLHHTTYTLMMEFTQCIFFIYNKSFDFEPFFIQKIHHSLGKRDQF
jgi:hypothetical protein